MHWHWLCQFFVVVSLLSPSYLCQDLSIPSSWRKPTSNLSRSERQQIAQAVVDSLIPLLNVTSGQVNGLDFSQSAKVLCAIFQHDDITATTRYKENATNFLHSVSQRYSGFMTNGTSLRVMQADAQNTTYNSDDLYSIKISLDALNWGLASMYAYRTYREQYLLDMAVLTWNEVYKGLITVEDAANGIHQTGSVSIASTCGGVSTAGGIVDTSNPKLSSTVDGATTSAFMALTAYLLEATSDPKYQEVANLSLAFLKIHSYNGTMLLDSFDVQTCERVKFCDMDSTGFFIEGLAVFTNVTGSTEWAPVLHDFLPAHVKTSWWSDRDGIMKNDPSANDTGPLTNNPQLTLKGMYVRSLFATWSRNGANPDIANFIQAFITVQYNALLDLAATPGERTYQMSWNGPPLEPGQVTPWGQLAALDVFNSAILMDSIPDANVSTTAGRTTIRTRIIIGVTVAIVSMVFLIALLVFVYLRRHRDPKGDEHGGESQVIGLEQDGDDDSEDTKPSRPVNGVQPFTLMLSSSQIRPEKPAQSSLDDHESRVESPTRRASSPRGVGEGPVHTSSHQQHTEISASEPRLKPPLTRRGVPQGPSPSNLSSLDQASQEENSTSGNTVIAGYDSDNTAAIQELILMLNQALARLPNGEFAQDEMELPPEYQESRD